MSEILVVPEFCEFRKIPRFNREVIITEKIDGTNAQICVQENGDIFVGSRNRWLSPEKDNFGFAAWAVQHTDALRTLGVGRHYGEWWGKGIQRGYGQEGRIFSLFNRWKWYDESSIRKTRLPESVACPECCQVVPILGVGLMEAVDLLYECHLLRQNGSFAAPGYMNPEGVVLFHTASNSYFKKTLENDEVAKNQNTKAA